MHNDGRTPPSPRPRPALLPSDVAPERKLQAAALGFALQAFLASGRPAAQVHGVSRLAWPAIQLRQFALDFDATGAAVGYLVWAFVSDDVLAELRAFPGRAMHLSEWNEGRRLWVLDVVGPSARRLRFLRQTLREHAPFADRVYGARLTPAGRVKHTDLAVRPVTPRTTAETAQ